MELYQTLNNLLGLELNQLHVYHMVFRCLIVYIFGIVILNVANKRFIGEKTPFDIILRFIIGSSLANAITGNSPFFATMGMVLFIIFLNSILSHLSLYSNFLDTLLKGKSVILYQNNKFNLKQMRKNHFTEEDLLSEVRKINGIDDLKEIQTIVLENSGEISAIPYSNKVKRHNNKRDDVED